MAAEIRAANPADADRLSRLGRATFTETFGHLYNPSDLSAFLDASHSEATYRSLFDRGDYGIWIATVDGEDAGYCVAGPNGLPAPGAPENAGELARLYFLKPYQKIGLGGRMLDLALAWLDERYDRIFLSVYAENFAAQQLYRRRGFVKVHDYFYMVGEHADPEWIMERNPAPGR